MTILAQHGYRRSDKIEQGIASGAIQGVIMSPRDETPTNLAGCLAGLQASHPTSERLVDPLFHIGTIWPARDGKLPLYSHYRSHLTAAAFSPQAIHDFVASVLDWQRGLDLTAVISPTVMVEDLSNHWNQIAMMLAQESIAQHSGDRPLLIGLVVGEDSLRQRAAVDTWLNDLTSLDVGGFYLVVRRGADSYRQQYDPDVLAGLLRVCYSLHTLNEYRLFAGYTDMATLLLHAVGVTATASGWFMGLRQFTLRRFQEVRGGRQARPRYSSRPLLNSIYMSDLGAIYDGGQLNTVLSGSTFDNRFLGNTRPEDVVWPLDDAAIQHWHVLADIAQSVVGSNVPNRLDSVRSTIGLARVLYAQASSVTTFSSETGAAHLEQWLDAVNRFRIDAGL